MQFCASICSDMQGFESLQAHKSQQLTLVGIFYFFKPVIMVWFVYVIRAKCMVRLYKVRMPIRSYRQKIR